MTTTVQPAASTSLARRPFRETPLGQLCRALVRNRSAMIGLAILAFWILVALSVTFIVPFNPLKTDVSARLLPPNTEHWFGTDDLGRDVLSRIIYGARISLRVGLIAVGIALSVGMTLGSLAGYYGGRLDNLIMRVMDIMLAFPSILLAIALMAVLGRGAEKLLEDGMVFSLEPKFVFPEGAAGFENTFVVTADGLEKLTVFDDGIGYL
ncbi:MAG: ABC transporter permease subunit [Peptococcaceae bacterium]|nr:ABC transporter permease subunit [Peptococcaceae bacterium]